MSAGRRYRTAFFALGWLLLMGVLYQTAFDRSFRRLFSRVNDRLTRFGQVLSDAEGSTLTRVRGKARIEEMASWRPVLDDPARLKNPPMMLFGAYDGGFPDSFDGFDDLERAVGARLPIISFYQAWGDRPDEREFPVRMVETIGRLGSAPMITWEPWVKDFDEGMRPNLAPVSQREYASLAAIGRGEYDFYVVPWARAAAAYGKPILLRFGHEMNDPYRYPWGPQNGNRTEDFIAAWRHLHVVFQKMGAHNVLWVWSPHISMPWFEYYYPGDEYVDWIGTGVLNYGDVAPWSRWWSFDQIFGKAYPALDKLGKPIMITEFATLDAGGDAADWYRQAFAAMHAHYPKIRSIVFFNQPKDMTLTDFMLDWRISRSGRALQQVRLELARGGRPPS